MRGEGGTLWLAADLAAAYTLRGLAAQLAAENFAGIDRDGDGRISLDGLMGLIDQFFRSDDSHHPGNLLLGQL